MNILVYQRKLIFIFFAIHLGWDVHSIYLYFSRTLSLLFSHLTVVLGYIANSLQQSILDRFFFSTSDSLLHKMDQPKVGYDLVQQ